MSEIEFRFLTFQFVRPEPSIPNWMALGFTSDLSGFNDFGGDIYASMLLRAVNCLEVFAMTSKCRTMPKPSGEPTIIASGNNFAILVEYFERGPHSQRLFYCDEHSTRRD